MGENDKNLLMLKAIRSSGLSDYYEATKKSVLFEYVASFCNDYEFVLNFLCLIEILKNNKDKLKEEELLILEASENMFDKLSKKCISGELDNSEAIIYLMYLSHSVQNNSIDDLSKIPNYLNRYYFRNRRFYLPDEIIVLFANTLIFLNQACNSDVTLVFDMSSKNTFSYRFKGRKEIVVGENLIKKINGFESRKKSNYYSLVYYSIYAIIHEFFHSFQFPRGIQNINEIEDSTYAKEAFVTLRNIKFYHKYHDNFKFENDADNFADEYINYILGDIMGKIMVCQSQIRVKYARKASKERIRVSKKKFAKLLNREYDNLKEEEAKKLKRSNYNGSN